MKSFKNENGGTKMTFGYDKISERSTQITENVGLKTGTATVQCKRVIVSIHKVLFGKWGKVKIGKYDLQIENSSCGNYDIGIKYLDE